MKKNSPKAESQLFWKSGQLITNRGRQFWQFKAAPELRKFIQSNKLARPEWLDIMSKAFRFNSKINPNSTDQVYRYGKTGVLDNNTSKIREQEIPTSSIKETCRKVLDNGWGYYLKLQDTKSGHFPGDYGGPLFLLPGVVLFFFLTKEHLDSIKSKDRLKPEQIVLIIRYILNHQNSDGGWGVHIEGNTSMFSTVLNYTALRLLPLISSKPIMSATGDIKKEISNALKRGKRWIKSNGGATASPPWGKYFLSLLGIYPWKGSHSLLPEAWLLPRRFFLSPENFWCHSRMVYLPLCYFYAVKFNGLNYLKSIKSDSATILERIRKDIFVENPLSKNNLTAARNNCHINDYHQPLTKRYKFICFFTNFYEKTYSKKLREKTIKTIIKHLEKEDDKTHFINLGPINKIYNALVVFHRLTQEPNNKELQKRFKQHTDRIKDYLWLAEDGLKMSGYNGSQFWDTVFSGKALLQNPDINNKHIARLEKIGRYIKHHQLPDGGWPFSTKHHSWPISDCSSEGIYLSTEIYNKQLIRPNNLPSIDNLKKSVDFILKLQNNDGGWSSYEKRNTHHLIAHQLEFINSSMIFNNIITDYSYPECTSAAIQALVSFSNLKPDYKKERINRAIYQAKKFILKKQKADGSWYGSWGVCFTYGIFFSVCGLLANQDIESNHQIKYTKSAQLGCNFLINHQNSNGSWGETFISSSQKKYHSNPKGQVVNTAWAIITLITTDKNKYKKAIQNGIKYLLKKQHPSGDWPLTSISGVFNSHCMISYTNYQNIFPLWAIGLYLKNCS